MRRAVTGIGSDKRHPLAHPLPSARLGAEARSQSAGLVWRGLAVQAPAFQWLLLGIR